jgi:hypothetical protein
LAPVFLRDVPLAVLPDGSQAPRCSAEPADGLQVAWHSADDHYDSRAPRAPVSRLVSPPGDLQAALWVSRLALADSREALQALPLGPGDSRVAVRSAALPCGQPDGSRAAERLAPLPDGCRDWRLPVDPADSQSSRAARSPEDAEPASPTPLAASAEEPLSPPPAAELLARVVFDEPACSTKVCHRCS